MLRNLTTEERAERRRKCFWFGGAALVLIPLSGVFPLTGPSSHYADPEMLYGCPQIQHFFKIAQLSPDEEAQRKLARRFGCKAFEKNGAEVQTQEEVLGYQFALTRPHGEPDALWVMMPEQNAK